MQFHLSPWNMRLQEEPKMKLKLAKRTLVTAGLVSCMAVAGISAYFTDGDTATNTFTVGKISMDLTETNWDAAKATKLTPRMELAKNPQIKNDGENDEFVFCTVTVPKANVVTANEDGTKNAQAITQLFHYGKAGTEKVDDAWSFLKKENETDASVTYVYAYTGDDATSLKALEKGSTTETLFDYIKFENVVEDNDLEGTNLDVVVNGYAIQTDNINETGAFDGVNTDGTVKPEEVWDVVKKANPSLDQGSEAPNTDVKNG